jgi:tetratricopeptide (TPR) repeat protein
MFFQQTIETIFLQVCEMPIQREHEIAELLIMYEKQLESHTVPDINLVHKAALLVRERLAKIPLDTELMLLALWVLHQIGQFDEVVMVLRQYLAEPRELDEQAWARWHLVDELALGCHHLEAVQEQRKYLHWAMQVYPRSSCFYVLADGTQALSWFRIGEGREWLSVLNDLLQQAEPTGQNRLDRFYCLRTAAYMGQFLSETNIMRHYAHAIRCLIEEDLSWTERRWVDVECTIIDIDAAHLDGQTEQVFALASAITNHLEEWEHHLVGAALDEIRQFSTRCHNVAAALYYRGKYYDLAIPLFRKAIAHCIMVHEPYLWLAACLWATTKQREEVLPLLVQAVHRYPDGGEPWENFRTLPEFDDVRDDPEFMQAARVVTEEVL